MPRIIHPSKAIALACATLFCAACKSPSAGPIRVQYLEIWAPALNEEFKSIARSWARDTHDSVEFIAVTLNDLPKRVAAFVDVPGAANLAVFPAVDAVIHASALADESAIVSTLATSGHTPLPNAEAMNKTQGMWPGVPLYAWSHLFVWRANLLRKKSLSPPTRFEGLLPVARILTDSSNGLYGFGLGTNGDDDEKMFVQSVLWSFGGAVFDSAGKVVLDSPRTRDALKYLVSLYRSGVMPPGIAGWDGASNNRAFIAGTIAGTANSPTILYALRHQDTLAASDVMHAMYPEGPAGRHTFATGFSLVSRRDDPKRDRVRELILFMMRPDNYARLLRAGEGSVNPQYSGYDTLSMWTNPQLRVALESQNFEHHVGWPGPVSAAAAEVFQRHILPDMVARVLNDGFTEDAAVREASRRVQEVVDRNASAQRP